MVFKSLKLITDVCNKMLEAKLLIIDTCSGKFVIVDDEATPEINVDTCWLNVDVVKKSFIAELVAELRSTPARFEAITLTASSKLTSGWFVT